MAKLFSTLIVLKGVNFPWKDICQYLETVLVLISDWEEGYSCHLADRGHRCLMHHQILRAAPVANNCLPPNVRSVEELMFQINVTYQNLCYYQGDLTVVFCCCLIIVGLWLICTFDFFFIRWINMLRLKLASDSKCNMYLLWIYWN